MTELVLRPLADAFMQVGVFVALLVAPFGWAQHRWGHRLDDALRRRGALAPLVAAGLTMPPGCGGAIIVMAAYARGAVSYGAAIAALVATMGDASWVLLAADPLLFATYDGSKGPGKPGNAGGAFLQGAENLISKAKEKLTPGE